MTRPQWQRTLGRPVRLVQNRWRGVRAGRWYGWSRPEWWPRDRPWPFGARNPHDGRHVTIFVGGHQYEFRPATYGRYRGHRFDGIIRPTVTDIAGHLAEQGLDPSVAAIFTAVSSIEGGFDAWQTYDRAWCSWGFVQFAGTSGLPAVLTRLKSLAPGHYDQYFGRAGIDVARGVLVVGTNGTLRRGWRALVRLHDDPALWRPFVQAAHDPVVRGVQVRTAYERYLLPVRERPITIGRRSYALGALIGEVPLGEAALFDHAVHRGLTYTQRLFQRAGHEVGRPDPDEILAVARRLEPRDQERWLTLERALGAPREPLGE